MCDGVAAAAITYIEIHQRRSEPQILGGAEHLTKFSYSKSQTIYIAHTTLHITHSKRGRLHALHFDTLYSFTYTKKSN